MRSVVGTAVSVIPAKGTAPPGRPTENQPYRNTATQQHDRNTGPRQSPGPPAEPDRRFGPRVGGGPGVRVPNDGRRVRRGRVLRDGRGVERAVPFGHHRTPGGEQPNGRGGAKQLVPVRVVAFSPGQ